MKIVRYLISSILFFAVTLEHATLVLGSSPSPPLKNLQVSLRGKKYEVSDVTTVQEVQERVQKESSTTNKEHHVLFGGKRLPPSALLRDVGVTDGAQLNMVPANKAKSSTTSSSSSKTTASTTSTTTAAQATTSAASASEAASAMQDYLKSAGVDTDKLDELMKSMGGPGGGAGGGEGGVPDVKESLEMMSKLMNNPMFQDYMNNPEMLEQSRQMILNNPMLKSMMSGMPGMGQILDDPVAWREAMQGAANLYKNMDSEQLQSMLSGEGGMPPGAGMPPGLFDGELDNSAAMAALDELDEDD